MIFTEMKKKQRDNLPIRVYVDCSRTYGPSKRQYGLIYRNAYRENGRESDIRNPRDFDRGL